MSRMESYDTKFDSFTPIPYDDSVVHQYYKEYTPMTALQSSGNTIEFSILGSAIGFIDTSKTKLKLRLKITEHDNSTVITAASDCSTLNDILHSCFRSMTLNINGVNFTDDIGHCAPFKNQLECLIEKSPTWFSSVGKAIGNIPDTTYCFNDIGPRANTNRGAIARQAYFLETGEREFEGFLNISALKLDKYLAPGVPFSIKLFQASPQFFLLAGTHGDKDDEQYKFSIEQISLLVYYVNPSEELRSMFDSAISQKPAIYKYPKITMKAFAIPANVSSVNIDNVITALPATVMAVMVTNTAFTGSYGTNAFLFDHFLVNYVSLTFEGSEINGRIYRPKFKKETENGIKPDQEDDGIYNALYEKDGYSTQGGMIAPQDLRGGNFILRWNLSQSLKKRESIKEKMQGLTRLSLGFSSALSEPVTVLIYTSTTGIFSINKNGRVEHVV